MSPETNTTQTPYLTTYDVHGNEACIFSITATPAVEFTYYSAEWVATTAEGCVYAGSIVYRPHDFWTLDTRLQVLSQEGLDRFTHDLRDVQTHSLVVDCLWFAALQVSRPVPNTRKGAAL
jgi:hypothetical protein